MKKVLCDINIVLDVLLKRDIFFETSLQIFQKIENGEFYGFLSGISIDTIFYILRKNGKNNEESHVIISQLLQIFDIATVDNRVIENALLLKTKDLEDAIQYESAIEEGCEIIFTRNVKDFPMNTKILICSPQNFLQ
jgi:predicted nucleic acid-binding protein